MNRMLQHSTRNAGSTKGNSRSARSLSEKAKLRDTGERNSGSLRLSEKAFGGNKSNDARMCGMVWQSKNTGPLDGILAANPDFSVLIVDDNLPMRSLIRTVLVSLGIFNIRESRNGAEGLADIRKQVPNLAIVDHDTASMKGLEFLQNVRRDPHSPDPSLPVLMTTDAPNQYQIFDIRDAGANDVLAKPISRNALGSHIFSILENQKNRPVCTLSWPGPTSPG